MTDPVDTDALRKIADELSTAISDPYDCEPLLRAAADEVDRLRASDWHADYQEAAADRDSILQAFATDSSSDVIAFADELSKLRATVDRMVPAYSIPQQARILRDRERLRAVIENAPHAYPCDVTQRFSDKYPCCCWKADA